MSKCKQHNWGFMRGQSGECQSCEIESLRQQLEKREEIEKAYRKQNKTLRQQLAEQEEALNDATSGLWSEWELERGKIIGENTSLTFENIELRAQLAEIIRLYESYKPNTCSKCGFYLGLLAESECMNCEKLAEKDAQLGRCVEMLKEDSVLGIVSIGRRIEFYEQGRMQPLSESDFLILEDVRRELDAICRKRQKLLKSLPDSVKKDAEILRCAKEWYRFFNYQDFGDLELSSVETALREAVRVREEA